MLQAIVLLHTSLRPCNKATERESVKHYNGLGTTGKHFFTTYVTMLKWQKFGFGTLQKTELYEKMKSMHLQC